MTVLFPLLLGLLQGGAEFLPISSSGHLALFQSFFGQNGAMNTTAVSVLLHVGTLFAVLIIYRKRILTLIPSFFRLVGRAFRSKGKNKALDDGELTVLYLFTALLPLVLFKIVDLIIERFGGAGPVAQMETYITRQPIVVGTILIFNGLLLLFCDRIVKEGNSLRSLGVRGALFVGTAQLFALLPGLSRSGTTIVASRQRGLSREEAVDFSFLLSIPTILGSLITEAPAIIRHEAIPEGQGGIYAAAVAVAFLTGLLSMKLLQYIARKTTFRAFAYYSFAVGTCAVCGGIGLLCR